MFYQGRKMSLFYREFDRIAERAEGVVVEINWLSSEAERRSHEIHRGTAYPVVEFSLPNVKSSVPKPTRVAAPRQPKLANTSRFCTTPINLNM